jgi:hypothetical protein
MPIKLRAILLSLTLASVFACSSDDADSLGIAAECTATEECDESTDQICLTDFKGGYCGIKDCIGDEDCPPASACVAHDDGSNYCFRTCVDKSECNANRSADQEANCAANISFVDTQDEGIKACVPPSG